MMNEAKISSNSLIKSSIWAVKRSSHHTQTQVFAQNLSLTRKTSSLIRKLILKNKLSTPLKS